MNANLPRRTTLLMLLASGCSSPEPAFYTLAASPGIARPGGPRLVELRDPSVAGYLDRSEIVRNDTSYKLDLRPGERWGEPFGSMLGRVLAEDLNQRLPGTTVFTSHGSLSPEPQAQIEVDVPTFDLHSGGRVVLRAQVAVTRTARGGSTSRTRSVQIETAPAAAGTPALVAAMSHAVGQLADAIATMLRTA